MPEEAVFIGMNNFLIRIFSGQSISLSGSDREFETSLKNDFESNRNKIYCSIKSWCSSYIIINYVFIQIKITATWYKAVRTHFASPSCSAPTWHKMRDIAV